MPLVQANDVTDLVVTPGSLVTAITRPLPWVFIWAMASDSTCRALSPASDAGGPALALDEVTTVASTLNTVDDYPYGYSPILAIRYVDVRH